MTLNAKMVGRINTFTNAHGQTLDSELLHMVMADLVEIYVAQQTWTQKPLLEARLTEHGKQEWDAYHSKKETP